MSPKKGKVVDDKRRGGLGAEKYCSQRRRHVSVNLLRRWHPEKAGLRRPQKKYTAGQDQ